MDFTQYIIALIGGLAAGCINTMAGNGSAITLPILTELIGLTPNQANATNRVGVMANAVSALTAFMRHGRWETKGSEMFILMGFSGGVLGVWLATIVSNEQFMGFFKFMMVFMLLVVLFKPDRWIKEMPTRVRISPWISWPIYFLIGVYGGFIQMGMGIFFLVVMVLIARFPVIQSNIAKMLVTLSFSIFSLLVFSWKGMIEWESGIVLAVGQATGAHFTAGYASRSPKAGLLAYWLLVVGISLSLIRLFGIDRLFLQWITGV
jgi:uncharacterized membrane protein YfcA